MYKKGDYIVVHESRVFRLCGFTEGHSFIPDGWLIDQDHGYVNPKHCRKYNGAVSAIPDSITGEKAIVN